MQVAHICQRARFRFELDLPLRHHTIEDVLLLCEHIISLLLKLLVDSVWRGGQRFVIRKLALRGRLLQVTLRFLSRLLPAENILLHHLFSDFVFFVSALAITHCIPLLHR